MSRYEDQFGNGQDGLEDDYESDYENDYENEYQNDYQDDFLARGLPQDTTTMSYQEVPLPPSAYSFASLPSHVSAGHSIPLTASHGSSYQTSLKTGTTSDTSAKPESGHSLAAMNPPEPPYLPLHLPDFWFTEGDNPETMHQQNTAGMIERDSVQVEVEAALQQNEIPSKYEMLALQQCLEKRELLGIAQAQPNSQATDIEAEIAHVRNMILESDPDADGCDRALDYLVGFEEIINSKKCKKSTRTSKTTSSKASRPPPGDTSKKDKLFQCISHKCNISFGHAGSLQRHIEDLHHPKAKIRCPWSGCSEICHRTDKFRDHCRNTHLWSPSRDEIKQYTLDLPNPAQCSLCSRMVEGWKEFYRCFKAHCRIGNGQEEARAPNDDGLNRESFDQGPFNAQSQSNGSNLLGLRINGIEMHNAPAYYNLGNNYYAGDSTQDWKDLQAQNCTPTAPQQASNMFRSSSDGIIARQPPQARLDVSPHAQNQKRQASEQDHSELPRGSNELGSNPQRPFKRSRQTRKEPQDNQQCRTCSHSFKDCAICKNKVVRPGARCHACPPRAAVQLQGSAPRSQISRPNELDPNQAGMIMNHLSMIDLGNPQQFPPAQNFPAQRSFGNGNMPSSRRPGNYGPSTGNPQGRSNFTNLVMSMDVSELSEEEMLSPKSKTPDACFGTWLSCLPIRASLPRWLSKVPQTAKALEYEETEEAVTPEHQLSISLPPSKLTNISPFVCGCPCVTKSLLSSNARVEIVPGRLLDMKITILPEGRTSHPLRTRVRVVVKILKLRSSVARSANKKKNQEDARTIQQVLMASLAGSASANLVEEVEEDAVEDTDVSESEDDDGLFSDVESVTSSVDDASSVADLGNALVPYKRSGYGDLFSDDDFDEESEDDEDVLDLIANRSSGPDDYSGDAVFDETQALYIESDGQEAEEVGEVELEMSFDLDLQDCLDTLASLTDGLADVQSSDDTVTDPELVFNYFFRYIVYLIFALSRSRVTARGE
ncbi:hypothetical protein N7454_010650 [Penicillium verhagenii]|nr:hypothetical protein N7454_010650 [Penicillium verhagenii]